MGRSQGANGSTGYTNGSKNSSHMSYRDIMDDTAGDGGAHALGSRLVTFRKWLAEEANCTVHSSVCIVNGEATDGTKNAPVLLYGPPPSASASAGSGGAANAAAGSGRCGMIDNDLDRSLYDRTMGCQVRTVRELKKDEIMMTIPRSAMITPDLVAASDAGRAILACCQPRPGSASDSTQGFWDVFEPTANNERKFGEKVAQNSGTQLLVKILQERKKVEMALAKAEKQIAEAEEKRDELLSRSKSPSAADLSLPYRLAANGAISTRAPFLAFILHQRFANEQSAPVVSVSNGTSDEMTTGSMADSNGIVDASKAVSRSSLDEKMPQTFSPYARILPSSVSLPICWKRNELALLAGCIPGMPPLQEVAARTLQLSSELIALVEAGLLHRFPGIFSRGMITWDRWVWAASIYSSRYFPASFYLHEGENSAFVASSIHSPPAVLDELGVMIPLLDMLNHEIEASQTSWVTPPRLAEGGDSSDAANNSESSADPYILMHKRAKKGSQVYRNYGVQTNQSLISQYGFAQLNNPADFVKIGWGLMDAVGDVEPPQDFDAAAISVVLPEDANEKKKALCFVYESVDPVCIKAWWTDQRLAVLDVITLINENSRSNLRRGKKMTAQAFSDGTYDPTLLSAAVVATMPSRSIQNHAQNAAPDGLTLTIRHQYLLQHYLSFVFTRKLEKLLQSLNSCLKDHFNNVQLWTRVTSGGLHYSGGNTEHGGGGDGPSVLGWQSFFDSYAYSTTMEVEKRYYAMGPDSCVLALYDGHLRSLQASIDGVATEEAFKSGVLRQLEELGFVISTNDDSMDISDSIGDASLDAKEKDSAGQTEKETDVTTNSPDSEVKTPSQFEAAASGDVKMSVDANAGPQPQAGSEKKEAPSVSGGDRHQNRRNRIVSGKKGDRPPAIKLHVGNLSYQTLPADLYDFFAGIYGKDNVLECHIPTERDTGNSRGFGFVTMPEEAAYQALQSGRQHEMDGRVLKVAESNSAGMGKSNRGGNAGVPVPSDRCATCGYRPRYCTCPNLNILPGAPHGMMGRPPPVDSMYGPPLHGAHADPYAYDRPPPDIDGRRGGRGQHRNDSRAMRSHSRSPSPRSHHRDSRYYSRSRSRSYSRGRDRNRDRDRRDRGRDRDEDRSRDHRSSGRRSGSDSWGRRQSRPSRYYRSRSRSRSRTRNRRGSPSGRHADRERKSGGESAGGAIGLNAGRSRSRSSSRPPSQSRGGREGRASSKKRDGKHRNRSRSRSRGRSSRRKRSKGSHRKETSKRHSRSRSHNRSKSRSWSKD